MTEAELRAKVVNQAAKYIGITKGSDEHKHIVDTYNAHTPLSRGYKVSYTDSWCATFVSTIFIEAGLDSLITTECGCGEMVSKNPSIWVESDSYVPKPGDIIMYDWQDNGTGDCTGWPDHTGIVELCDGTTIQVIEGNINKSCARTKYAVNGQYIRGFITPNFASIATAPEAKRITPKKRYIYTGSDCTTKCNVQYDGKIRNYLLDSDNFEIVQETNTAVQIKVTDWTTWTPWVKKADLE